ncbi:assimilatory sulfite reductase (NADPH) flavoprotein subunit [Metabacillus sp. 84]|uniref:assimilatory sulfite reductase (NADPH) flavoprotein subunit n=1 Tax=unclassified Metabacillus TaxID=2675274 RepID=UPI003CED86D0
MPLHVTNSPFNQEQADLLNQLLPSLNPSQKMWLAGYLAAIDQDASSGTAVTQQQNESAPVSKEVTILYGSQTGNAQGLAAKSGKKLEENGFKVTVSSMNDFKPNSLKKLENLLIAVSTHGEGDPPDNALTFHEFLHGKRAPKLEGLRYSVLSLGDSSYEKFCQTGKEFDLRLEELGASRLAPRTDCDLDYDEPAAEWLDKVLAELQGAAAQPVSNNKEITYSGESTYTRTNPFYAEILESINLNGRGSDKETTHLELSLEGSGLSYEPGDSLGIYPENDPALVNLIIDEMKWDENETVKVNKQGETKSLKEALTSNFEITVLTKPLLEQSSQLTDSKELKELLSEGHEEELKTYLKGRDLLDLLRDYGPWKGSAQDLLSILRKIPGRLYSIASSLEANPEEVHLTIGAVRYESYGRSRSGVCSILCAERLQPGDKLPVYVQSNQNFKLPENGDTPIIMIGPGTGIAPFRSFMQEREEKGAGGRSWLFFGDRHFVTDFLYQTEWQKWIKDGVLTKMNVAFSRDTAEKVYVQHRMLENSKELYEWIQSGAAVYVCGDEKNMAHDVHNSLITIIAKEGNMGKEEAEKYIAAMQQEKRYQRDVY